MEIISGPATLEGFLEGDFRRQERIIVFMSEAVEEMWQRSNLPDGKIDFQTHVAAEQMAEYLERAQEELHEIELAKSGLKIGNRELAKDRLGRAVSEMRELTAQALGEGRGEVAEQLQKRLTGLLMLKEDVEVE